MSYLTPAEKLTTGKNRPSRLKFSNMPWTGCPLIRKEILGTLRSKQQLTTSSAARMCWLGVATWRGTRPVDTKRKLTHVYQYTWNLKEYISISCRHQKHQIHYKKIHIKRALNKGNKSSKFKTVRVKCMQKTTSKSYHVYFTWPEVKPVKTVGVEVIPDPIAPPAFPSTRVRTVALRQSPTHTQVIWLSCKERLHVVHHHLKIPLLILSGPFTSSKENVGSHAKGG